MQQTNASTNAQTSQTLYYQLILLALLRASYSQTCSDTKLCGTSAQRNRGTPYSSQRSSLLEYDTA